MPKVKKKAAKKQTRGRASEDGEGFFSRFGVSAARFAPAALAGLTIVAIGGGVLLWSGGYVGLVGESAGRAANNAAVAAGFEITRITARGAEKTADADILNAVGPVVGSSIMKFDPHAARARVEQLGWVRSAAVSRLWPNTVHVSVREREPAAVWQLSGALHLIDQSGAVIREIDAFEYSNLPLIVGAGAPDAASGMLGALREEPALWGAAAALIRVGDRRWNLRLKSGADVKFPENGYEAAVRDLAQLHAAYGLLDQPLEYIDLRDPNHLVYREAGARETELGSLNEARL